MQLFAIFMPGPIEMCIFGFVAVLLFGNRLPGVARAVGSSLVEFKKGVREIEDEVKDVKKAANENPE